MEHTSVHKTQHEKNFIFHCEVDCSAVDFQSQSWGEWKRLKILKRKFRISYAMCWTTILISKTNSWFDEFSAVGNVLLDSFITQFAYHNICQVWCYK